MAGMVGHAHELCDQAAVNCFWAVKPDVFYLGAARVGQSSDNTLPPPIADVQASTEVAFMAVPNPSDLSSPSNTNVKEPMKACIKWLLRVIHHSLQGGRRFVHVSPPSSRRQLIYDRSSSKWLSFRSRDLIDYEVIQQVFASHDYGLNKLRRGGELEELYASIVESGRTPLILDCGANRGIASSYFAETYAHARIVGVEPEQANFDAAVETTSRYPNVVLVKAAVSSKDGLGAVHDPGGGNWAYQVRPSENGDINFFSIETLLKRFGGGDASVPFIAKIDIEGFESDLFSSNVDWIDKFPILIIELHDWMLPKKANSKSFLQAVAARQRDFVFFGENVFSISNAV